MQDSGYKTLVAGHLRRVGHDVRDFGTDSETPVDYPDLIRPLALAVAHGEVERGVVFGGSGNGEAMTANRCRGVRCAVAWNLESARLGRAHNDANVLSIGQRLVPADQLFAIVDMWLTTAFEGGRHVARIRKLDEAGRHEALIVGSPEENLGIVRTLYAAFGAGNIPAMLELLADGVEWGEPENPFNPAGGTHRGHKGFLEWIEIGRNAEEILTLEPRRMITDAETVGVVGFMKCRARSTGRTYESDFVHVITIKDGKVARFQEFFDTYLAGEAFRDERERIE